MASRRRQRTRLAPPARPQRRRPPGQPDRVRPRSPRRAPPTRVAPLARRHRLLVRPRRCTGLRPGPQPRRASTQQVQQPDPATRLPAGGDLPPWRTQPPAPSSSPKASSTASSSPRPATDPRRSSRPHRSHRRRARRQPTRSAPTPTANRSCSPSTATQPAAPPPPDSARQLADTPLRVLHIPDHEDLTSLHARRKDQSWLTPQLRQQTHSASSHG